jgi:hypothetical protein
VVIEKILTHLASKDPCAASARLARSRAPPQSSLFGINAFVRAAALELGDSLRINAISPIFVKETMEMMGMDSASGMSASDTAKAYQVAMEGSATGEVIDIRDVGKSPANGVY